MNDVERYCVKALAEDGDMTCRRVVKDTTGTATGNAEADIEMNLLVAGNVLQGVVVTGAADARAQARKSADSVGDAEVSGEVSFSLTGPTLAILRGTLKSSFRSSLGKPRFGCAAVTLQGDTGTWIHVGDRAACGFTGAPGGRVFETVILPGGDYTLQVHGYTSVAATDPGTESGSASFFLTMGLATCDNEFTDGNDVITGTGGDDVLCGGAGDDYIRGFGGDDTLDGGHGRDTLEGGTGRDGLFGGPDDDFLEGGSGDDAIEGQGGRDVLRGEDGRDRLVGGPGKDDLLNGGAGGDDLQAQDGARDTVRGGPGADVAKVDRRDVVGGVERVKR